jgi:putative acetyltransferase
MVPWLAILFSRMDVSADGNPIPAAALAPVAVLPAHRNQGIATALLEAGHDALRQQGISIAFVLGDPVYYTRFGYNPALAAPFASPYAGPHFMACALDSALPIPQRGHAHHAAAFSRLA